MTDEPIVDRAERLAAYAAGDLDPAERAALEAELDRDAGLRAELDQIRAVDRFLAELPEVVPPADFSARLRETALAELTSHAEVASLEEARARRGRTTRRLGTVAAAAAAFGFVAVGVGSLFQGAEDTASSSDEERTAEMAAPLADDAADSSMVAEAQSAPAEPVYAEGGAYDQDTLTDLGTRRDVRAALLAVSGDPVFFQDRNLDILATLAATSGQANAATSGGTQAAPEEDGDGPQLDALDVFDDAIRRCVPEILIDDAVPLFADRGTYEGQQALVVVLGTRDADGAFGRLEFWVLDPDDCTVRHFAQQG